ncbi:MAG: alkane 1-monooxygenase [Bacteroidetes bacterium]|nr:alkane 1-monooxygenase [Bacteroidota bacterium]
MRNAKYLLSLTPGMVVVTGNLAGGWYMGMNTFFSFVVLALLEFFTSEDKSNKCDKEDKLPDLILYTHVLMQTACIVSFFYSLKFYDNTPMQLMLGAFSLGIHSSTSAIIIAHELIHRPNAFMQTLGKYLLFTAGNCYFYVDHLRVHHKYVGTEKDPATSVLNETIYRFFIRSCIGQIKSSIKLENKRIEKEKASMLSNYVFISIVGILALTVTVYFAISPLGALAFLFHVLIANFLLEYVNYIEHYGLIRNENERVREIHSWQSDKVISRFFLIDLSRHADHHYYASKPYHTLMSYENSPVLPGGYAQMIYYVLIPPLWFKATHRILKNRKLI